MRIAFACIVSVKFLGCGANFSQCEGKPAPPVVSSPRRAPERGAGQFSHGERIHRVRAPGARSLKSKRYRWFMERAGRRIFAVPENFHNSQSITPGRTAHAAGPRPPPSSRTPEPVCPLLGIGKTPLYEMLNDEGPNAPGSAARGPRDAIPSPAARRGHADAEAREESALRSIEHAKAAIVITLFGHPVWSGSAESGSA